jgi:hypothetical protein
MSARSNQIKGAPVKRNTVTHWQMRTDETAKKEGNERKSYLHCHRRHLAATVPGPAAEPAAASWGLIISHQRLSASAGPCIWSFGHRAPSTLLPSYTFGKNIEDLHRRRNEHFSENKMLRKSTQPSQSLFFVRSYYSCCFDGT